MTGRQALHAVGGLPQAPAYLTAERKLLWREVVRAYELGADELALLAQACVALDRAAEAREAVERDGILVSGRYGLRQNPATVIERDQVMLASRLFKQLALELPPLPVDRLALRKRGQR